MKDIIVIRKLKMKYGETAGKIMSNKDMVPLEF